MHDSLISVIVPVYNAEKTLARCVESILNQTYSSFELILVDDGSADGSGAMCDAYEQQCGAERCVVVHKKNGGVSSARNVGMERVRGEYFVCVDSDDYVEPDYLESLMRARRQFPDAGHIWCGYKAVSKDAGGDCKVHVLSETEPYTVLDRRDYMTLSGQWFTQMPWHRLYRTALVKEKDLRMNESMSLGEDLIFNLDYLDAEPKTIIVVVNRPCYDYVQDEGTSLNNRYRDNLLEINTAIDAATKGCLKQWNADDAAWQQFYNESFYRYEHVFDNVFHPNNSMTKGQKITYLNGILRSPEFCETLQHCSCPMNGALRFAYRRKEYRLVLLFKQLVRIKYGLKQGV